MRTRNELMLFTTLVTAVMSGCIIHDNDCERPEGELTFDTGEMDPGAVGQFTFSLSPDQGVVGDTFITSVASDDDVNFAEINEVFFLGEVTMCTTQARQGELLMTISIDEQAEEGAVDLVIGFEDGTAYLINDALFISQDIDFGGDTDAQGDGSADGEDDDIGADDGGGSEGDQNQDSQDLGEGGCG